MKISVISLTMAAFFTNIGSVSAQELYVDRSSVFECFNKTPVGATIPFCLGRASNQCQKIRSGTADGGTTIGITTCIQAETRVWDEILNIEYNRLQAQLAEDDARRVLAGLDRTDSL